MLESPIAQVRKRCREMSGWFNEVKKMVENILPRFWQALPLVKRDAGIEV